MSDLTKKLLGEYRAITERKFVLAKENYEYCCENSKKYGHKTWQEGMEKWAMRMDKHTAKLSEIQAALTD